MRKRLMVMAVLAGMLGWCPLSARAQDMPRAEIFGGYSYLLNSAYDLNFHGWNASATANINNWFGVKADFSGQYGNGLNTHLFNFGPQVKMPVGERFKPFAHALVGFARFSGGPEKGFSTVLGVGMDAKLTDKVAIRLFQSDYVLTRFFGASQHNFRFSTGLVLRLGER